VDTEKIKLPRGLPADTADSMSDKSIQQLDHEQTNNGFVVNKKVALRR
jgi:hypothetical protein